jgi:hypothetical protein
VHDATLNVSLYERFLVPTLLQARCTKFSNRAFSSGSMLRGPASPAGMSSLVFPT